MQATKPALRYNIKRAVPLFWVPIRPLKQYYRPGVLAVFAAIEYAAGES